MSITQTPVLAADALLGVKYVLSHYPVRGLKAVEGQPVLNGKSVYENPSCLPLAFCYEKTTDAQGVQMNPFEYQNSLYRALTGDADTELYIPVPYRAECVSGDRAVYRLDIPEGDYALYGNLEWGNEMDAILDANGSYETGYAVRISPSVFYIPAKEGAVSAYVLLQAMDGLDIREEQFYALDLDALSEAERQISQKAAEEIEVENGYARFVATRQEEGEYLFTSIPYDPGWRVAVDGVAVEAGTFGDCLMTVPLHGGRNEVVMEYRVPCLGLGLFMTVVGVGLACWLMKRMRVKK